MPFWKAGKNDDQVLDDIKETQKQYVLIPDSFKGTLSSLEVCRIVAEEIRAQEPDAEICAIPVADGGEGTVDAFLAAVGGQRVRVACHGPYGEPLSCLLYTSPSPRD